MNVEVPISTEIGIGRDLMSSFAVSIVLLSELIFTIVNFFEFDF